jgi:hypothetical protein
MRTLGFTPCRYVGVTRGSRINAEPLAKES